jgi:hypothetical protein
MKTSLHSRIRIALAGLLFAGVAVTAWSCACSTSGHVAAGGGGDMGMGDSGGGTSTGGGGTSSDGSGSSSSSSSGSGSSSSSGSGSGSSSSSGSGSGSSSSSSTLPKRGEQCAQGNACDTGLQCVSYYGIAGPKGPQFTSCETPCKDNAKACTGGTKCVNIADGPGMVCR